MEHVVKKKYVNYELRDLERGQLLNVMIHDMDLSQIVTMRWKYQ